MTVSFRLIGPPLPRWQRTHNASPEPAEPMRLLELQTRAELAIERIDRLRAARAPRRPCPACGLGTRGEPYCPGCGWYISDKFNAGTDPKYQRALDEIRRAQRLPSAQPRIAHLQADVRLP